MNREGLIHVYTGDGKGKTTAAVGLAVRAAGSGMKVLFAQFLKGQPTGEITPLERLGVTVVRSDEVKKFIPNMTPQELEECRAAQQRVLDAVKAEIGRYDLAVLDEVCAAVTTGMIDIGDVIALIENRPRGTEIVLTGRDAPQRFIELADYVSKIKPLKHPFERGIGARKGIEY